METVAKRTVTNWTSGERDASARSVSSASERGGLRCFGAGHELHERFAHRSLDNGMRQRIQAGRHRLPRAILVRDVYRGANATFIATLELVGGICLMLGLGTRIFALLLSGSMTVAQMLR